MKDPIVDIIQSMDTEVMMKSHNWGYIGLWGIIFGVHKCVTCGVVAQPKTLYTHCL